MRILCSNDDGINAPGLAALERIAHALTDDVWVVAPEAEQSGASRSLTISDPIRKRRISERKFAISGTPSDAVAMALMNIIDDGKPVDLVLSGVNNGQNLAEDVTVSGTIAAAFQAMQSGVRAAALSLARFSYEKARWCTAEVHAPEIIRKLMETGWPDDVVVNVNFPDVEAEDVREVVVTRQGVRDERQLTVEERTDLRGRKYYWFGFRGTRSTAVPGTDLKAVYEGCISITPLHLELTHERTRVALEQAFAGVDILNPDRETQ